MLDAAEQISRPRLLTRIMEPLRPNALAASVGKVKACLEEAVLSFQVSATLCTVDLMADQIFVC